MSLAVFLGGLPPAIGREDIEAWLRAEEFRFRAVSVVRKEEAPACAFVIVDREEDLQPIVTRFHGAPLDGRRIRASVAEDRRRRHVTESA